MSVLASILSVDPPQTAAVSDLIQVVLAIASTGTLGVTLTAILSRRKTAAEARRVDAEGGGASAAAAASLSGTAISLIAPMQEEIRRLAARVSSLESERDASRIRETSLSLSLNECQVELTDCRAWMQLAHQLITTAGLHIDPPPQGRTHTDTSTTKGKQ